MNPDIKKSEKVVKLLELLDGYSRTDKLLFGQQNAGHIGISIEKTDGTDSDCKRLCGKMPAVVGIDTLSFLGYEGKMADLVKTVKNLYRQGCIITLSSHMPDFSLGGDNFYDYSPTSVENDCGRRIMPGGDLNAKYLRFLDLIADFASQCIDVEGDLIPMIFRPFHECNGSWFWWGAKYLTDEEYIALFRYTIDYLLGIRGITNLAVAYSPNGFFAEQSHYMSRYPGDDIIDIMGMDIYDDAPHKGDTFFRKLQMSLDVMLQCAQIHGKIPALTETGYRALETPSGYFEGLAPEGNDRPAWFTDLLACLLGCEGGERLSYMLIWANFSETQFWLPYIKGDFEHELCEDFREFAGNAHTVFAPVKGTDGMV